MYKFTRCSEWLNEFTELFNSTIHTQISQQAVHFTLIINLNTHTTHRNMKHRYPDYMSISPLYMNSQPCSKLHEICTLCGRINRLP